MLNTFTFNNINSLSKITYNDIDIYSFCVNVQEIPLNINGETNLRFAQSNHVSTKLVFNTLKNEPEMLLLRSDSISYSASEIECDNINNRVIIKIDNQINGLINGGHRILAIKNAIEDKKIDLSKAFIRIEIIVKANKNVILDITKTRNKIINASSSDRANAEGYYDYIKELTRGTIYENNISFKTGKNNKHINPNDIIQTILYFSDKYISFYSNGDTKEQKKNIHTLTNINRYELVKRDHKIISTIVLNNKSFYITVLNIAKFVAKETTEFVSKNKNVRINLQDHLSYAFFDTDGINSEKRKRVSIGKLSPIIAGFASLMQKKLDNNNNIIFSFKPQTLNFIDEEFKNILIHILCDAKVWTGRKDYKKDTNFYSTQSLSRNENFYNWCFNEIKKMYNEYVFKLEKTI